MRAELAWVRESGGDWEVAERRRQLEITEVVRVPQRQGRRAGVEVDYAISDVKDRRCYGVSELIGEKSRTRTGETAIECQVVSVDPRVDLDSGDVDGRGERITVPARCSVSASLRSRWWRARQLIALSPYMPPRMAVAGPVSAPVCLMTRRCQGVPSTRIPTGTSYWIRFCFMSPRWF